MVSHSTQCHMDAPLLYSADCPTNLKFGRLECRSQPRHPLSRSGWTTSMVQGSPSGVSAAAWVPASWLARLLEYRSASPSAAFRGTCTQTPRPTLASCCESTGSPARLMCRARQPTPRRCHRQTFFCSAGRLMSMVRAGASWELHWLMVDLVRLTHRPSMIRLSFCRGNWVETIELETHRL